MRSRGTAPIGKFDLHSLMGAVRLFVCGIGLILFIGWFGATQIDGISPRDLAEEYRKTYWFLQYASDEVLVIIASVINWNTFRYMIAPISAIIFVIIAGSLYVQDIYSLSTFRLALTYVLASMFGSDRLTITIDNGVKQLDKKEDNLIDKIGGPGYVVIQPGSAAMFRELRRPTEGAVSTTYFLGPFETIAQTASLDEQQGDKTSITAMTRDGIKVEINDVHFRYRAKQEEIKGVPVRRTPEKPYPVSDDTLRNMTLNLQALKDKTETWQDAVERAVVGEISDFVSANRIDDMTAPRSSQRNTRLELRKNLLESGLKNRLARLGAELLWVDVGHIEIIDETVDEVRTNLWSADWAGDAKENRAYGDAIRQAYNELGRAEAQADLIMSIANALRDVNLSNSSSDNIRKVLLAQTAQILRALSKNGKDKNNSEQSQNL